MGKKEQINYLIEDYKNIIWYEKKQAKFKKENPVYDDKFGDHYYLWTGEYRGYFDMYYNGVSKYYKSINKSVSSFYIYHNIYLSILGYLEFEILVWHIELFNAGKLKGIKINDIISAYRKEVLKLENVLEEYNETHETLQEIKQLILKMKNSFIVDVEQCAPDLNKEINNLEKRLVA
jgi:hypothetical protein